PRSSQRRRMIHCAGRFDAQLARHKRWLPPIRANVNSDSATQTAFRHSKKCKKRTDLINRYRSKVFRLTPLGGLPTNLGRENKFSCTARSAVADLAWFRG